MKFSFNLYTSIILSIYLILIISNTNATKENDQQIELSKDDRFASINDWTDKKLKRGMNLGRKMMCQVDPRNCASLVGFNGETKRFRETLWKNEFQPMLRWIKSDKGRKYLSSFTDDSNNDY